MTFGNESLSDTTSRHISFKTNNISFFSLTRKSLSKLYFCTTKMQLSNIIGLRITAFISLGSEIRDQATIFALKMLETPSL